MPRGVPNKKSDLSVVSLNEGSPHILLAFFQNSTGAFQVINQEFSSKQRAEEVLNSLRGNHRVKHFIKDTLIVAK